MTDQDICLLYKEAKHKKRQIRILSDLTLMSPLKIKEILQKHGFNVNNLPNTGKGACCRAWYDEKAQRLYDMGVDVKRIADIIGITLTMAKEWHYRNGYEFNEENRCSCCVHSREKGNGKLFCVFEGNVNRTHICNNFEGI